MTFESSYDGGVSWVGVTMTSTFGTSSSGLGLGQWEGGLPAGCTHFRVRCTVAGAGSQTVTISTSPAIYRTSQIVNIVSGSAVALNAGGARIGVVSAQSQAFFTDETTTPLAGTGVATSITRDLAQTSSPGTITSPSATMKEFRALAVADVTGTLYVEVSADQVTWWRISATPTVAVGAIFYAQASVLPATRYARTVYVNGAGAQSAFLLSTSRFD